MNDIIPMYPACYHCPPLPACDRCRAYVATQRSAVEGADSNTIWDDACSFLGRLHDPDLAVGLERSFPLGHNAAPESLASAEPGLGIFPAEEEETSTLRPGQGHQNLPPAAAEGSWGTRKTSVVARYATQNIVSALSFRRPADPLFSGLSSKEIFLLHLFFDRSSLIRHFVLGPKFADGVLGNLFASLYSSPELLLSSFLSLSAGFARKGTIGLENYRSVESVHVPRALKELQTQGSKTMLTKLDITTAANIGVGLMTWDILTTGKNAHAISRFTLGLAARFYESNIAREPSYYQATVREVESIMYPLFVMDTYNCLIRRQIPVLKVERPDPELVDRFLGVCVHLLPYLFDLCHVSRDLRIAELGDGAEGTPIFDNAKIRLRVIESTIRSWIPTVPRSFAASATATEIDIIEGQGRLHQYAVLLVIHRIWHPFGSEDAIALGWSRQILTGIEKMCSGAGHEMHRGLNDDGQEAQVASTSTNFDYRILFPLFVAALELTDPTERLATVTEMLGIVLPPMLYQNIIDIVAGFLEYVWEARDRGYRARWFGLVDSGPSFIII